MKALFIICGGLVILILGAGIGYHYGKRKGHNDAIAEAWMDSMERAQLNGEYEARAYYRCLQDIDSGSISNLHRFALWHLRYYVSDVQQTRQQGHTWAPHIPSLYSNANAYLVEVSYEVASVLLRPFPGTQSKKWYFLISFNRTPRAANNNPLILVDLMGKVGPLEPETPGRKLELK